MKKQITTLLLACAVCINICAQNFNDYFINKTLRLDYIFSGTNTISDVALDEISQLPQWAGRTNNLDKLVWGGNGQISVYDKVSNKLIYKDSFSTLFQEWQSTPEAETVKKSFENTYLVPYPKQDVVVEISFRNKKGEYESKIRHTVNPNDILIKQKGYNNVTPYTTLHKGGEKAINVAILAEGYTKDEMDKFREHAHLTSEAILTHNGFNKFTDKFNIIAVESESHDSGVAVPRNQEWKKTAFSSHFDTFYSERYLTTTKVKAVHDVLAGTPYTHIIILANTDVYGGGGIFNSYTLTTTGHPNFKPVVVHEFGHSFVGLADEYFYENDTFSDSYVFDIEPWEPNVTSLVNFESKWKSLLKKDTPIPTPQEDATKYKVAVIEGAAYSAKGLYRASDDCRMRTNTAKDFCPACERAIEQIVNFYTE